MDTISALNVSFMSEFRTWRPSRLRLARRPNLDQGFNPNLGGDSTEVVTIVGRGVMIGSPIFCQF